MLRLAYLAVFIFLLAGCENSTPAPVGQLQPSAERTIPKDVTYTIIGTDILPGIKRSLDIRLNRKTSEDVLRLIAIKLKNADEREYQRTFIVYFLPGMRVGGGAWATTHFDPNLTVRILGLTSEEESSLISEPQKPSREVIGRWLDETPFIGGRITIYRERGKLHMERKFKDGSSLSKDMVEKSSSRGRRFEEREGSSVGEYYLIDRQGNLQVGDQDGLIAIAKKIN